MPRSAFGTVRSFAALALTLLLVPAAVLVPGALLLPAALAAQSGDDPIGTLGEDRGGAEAQVHHALNDFHRAAATADSIAYFGAFTANGVFLGTDATERWTVDEFRGYARSSFSRGRGWTYVPTERWVTLSPEGGTAWFDERLTNSSYGETRGSGALVRTADGWKVAQYNLTIPIPNDLAREFAARIRELGGG